MAQGLAHTAVPWAEPAPHAAQHLLLLGNWAAREAEGGKPERDAAGPPHGHAGRGGGGGWGGGAEACPRGWLQAPGARGGSLTVILPLLLLKQLVEDFSVCALRA